MAITLYGIPNCDTVKKARGWLDAHGLAHRFHDTRKDAVTAADLELWCDQLGWERVLNRAGTTFRALPEAERAGLDRPRAIALMLRQPAMIKRPIVAWPGGLLLGFSPALWSERLAV